MTLNAPTRRRSRATILGPLGGLNERTRTLVFLVMVAAAGCGNDDGSALRWTFSSLNFATAPIVGDVQQFGFTIELQGPIQPGQAYVNPPLTSVDYTIIGNPVEGSPSGFPAFQLERLILGSDFYDQGSGLRFEVRSDASLDDGLQVAELVGTSTVFTFDGREIDNGRFHPALLELRADGTGRLQNSNNVPSLDPRVDVAFGAEYVTQLSFDPTRVTVLTTAP